MFTAKPVKKFCRVSGVRVNTVAEPAEVTAVVMVTVPAEVPVRLTLNSSLAVEGDRGSRRGLGVLDRRREPFSFAPDAPGSKHHVPLPNEKLGERLRRDHNRLTQE